MIVWVFYPETGGQPLEAIDTLFLTQDHRNGSILVVPDDYSTDTKGGVLDKLQWSIVRKADMQVKAYKRAGRNRPTPSDGDEVREVRENAIKE
jgi:hypothetical protein